MVYGSENPAADAGYRGQIRFSGQGSYRTAMHGPPLRPTKIWNFLAEPET